MRTRFSLQPRNPRAWENRTSLVTCHQIPVAETWKAFRPKCFLHICNGSSNLCAFTEARPSTGTGFPIVVSFSRWIRPHRSTDSVVSAIAFREFIFHAWVRQTGCIKRSPNLSERDTERDNPVSNCT